MLKLRLIYHHDPKTAPKDSMTITTLFKLLTPMNIPKDVIGCSFFELDTRNVGYVYCNKENYEQLMTILSKEMFELQQEEKEAQQRENLSSNTTTTTNFDEGKVRKVLEHYCVKHLHQTTATTTAASVAVAEEESNNISKPPEKAAVSVQAVAT